MGETFLLGTTWHDLQHHGTMGRMISMTPGSGLHFCWMNGIDEGAYGGRHVYYNYFANGVLMWPGVGFGPLDQGDRGGYCTVSHLAEGEAVVAFHNWGAKHTEVAIDFYEGSGSFQGAHVENLPDVGELIWPKVAVCNQGNIHLVAFEYNDLYWSRIAYARSEYGGASFSAWTVFDSIVTISPDIAASPVSNKVGIAYTKPSYGIEGPIWYQSIMELNNDVMLVESEDGITWDFSDRRNITNLIQPDTSRYPDTTWAWGDTLRAFCDVSLLYDQNDYAHVAFTTRGVWLDPEAGFSAPPDTSPPWDITMDASMIWHWSEEHDTVTVIADGWYDVGNPADNLLAHRGAGAYRSTIDRPCLAQDSITGYMYCVYVRCARGDTSGGEEPSYGWANGDIYCSVSTDGGLNWSVGSNLTNTPSPNCSPGDCFDEDYPSQTLVVNDTLHIIYVEDKDAGGVVWKMPQEGIWTENPVRYQKVPADYILPGPPYVPNFYFHVGPVGATDVEEQAQASCTVPECYALHQNYPNPFNTCTEIRYQIPEAGHVTLEIFNSLGQEVQILVDKYHMAGEYSKVWDGRDGGSQEVASGLYFCRLEGGGLGKTIKMVLMR